MRYTNTYLWDGVTDSKRASLDRSVRLSTFASRLADERLPDSWGNKDAAVTISSDVLPSLPPDSGRVIAVKQASNPG